MSKIALAVCLLLISCSRVIVDRGNLLQQDKVSLLPVNAAFKTRNFNGSTVYFSDLDLSLLDQCPNCIDLRNNLKLSYDQAWYKYMHNTAMDHFNVLQNNNAAYVAIIRIEQIRTQHILNFLNPLGTPGKIVTYSVSITEKQSGELCFGMKGEWIYFSTSNLVLLAVDITSKMI